MRVLVRVIGWALYSDHLWIVFVDAKMDGRERRYDVGGVRALPREVVFGIFIKLFRIDQRVLYTLWET